MAQVFDAPDYLGAVPYGGALLLDTGSTVIPVGVSQGFGPVAVGAAQSLAVFSFQDGASPIGWEGVWSSTAWPLLFTSVNPGWFKNSALTEWQILPIMGPNIAFSVSNIPGTAPTTVRMIVLGLGSDRNSSDFFVPQALSAVVLGAVGAGASVFDTPTNHIPGRAKLYTASSGSSLVVLQEWTGTAWQEFAGAVNAAAAHQVTDVVIPANDFRIQRRDTSLAANTITAVVMSAG